MHPRYAPDRVTPSCDRRRRLLAVLILLIGLTAAAGCGLRWSPSGVEPTLQSLQTAVASQATRLAEHELFISHLATRIPPRPPVTPSRPTATPIVVGSVLIEDGRCCVGGPAGQHLLIRVELEAFSPAGPVTEMRLRAGVSVFQESDFTDGEWEPFAPSREFEFLVPLNWVGFIVTAQFRDVRGNLSGLVSDEVSVEGWPPPPTATE